jgi:hypothetical protein
MPPTIPEPTFGGFNFGSEFLPAVDFGEAFNFSGDFSFLPEVFFLPASSLSNEAMEYDNVSWNFSVKSVVLLRSKDPKHCHQKQHFKNCTSHIVSMRICCWYINYLEPGPV